MSKNSAISAPIRKSFPWTLWYLWKNRNWFFLEGKELFLPDIMLKIQEESSQWFNAQTINTAYTSSRTFDRGRYLKTWLKPPSPWLKCNIGMVWSKQTLNGGFSWVLRDANGTVLLHSRRSFSGLISLHEAQFQSILWTVDCM